MVNTTFKVGICKTIGHERPGLHGRFTGQLVTVFGYLHANSVALRVRDFGRFVRVPGRHHIGLFGRKLGGTPGQRGLLEVCSRYLGSFKGLPFIPTFNCSRGRVHNVTNGVTFNVSLTPIRGGQFRITGVVFGPTIVGRGRVGGQHKVTT